VGCVLPLIDPPLLALLSVSEAMGLPVPLGLMVLAFGNWLVLSKLADGAWTGSARNKRIVIGLAVSFALAVPFAVAEFIGYLLIVCSQQTCFS
jgi:hypothetical protein